MELLNAPKSQRYNLLHFFMYDSFFTSSFLLLFDYNSQTYSIIVFFRYVIYAYHVSASQTSFDLFDRSISMQRRTECQSIARPIWIWRRGQLFYEFSFIHRKLSYVTRIGIGARPHEC